jgi:uncharacterized protein YdhG (YjbR/CyaY superfamily)
MKSKTSSVKEYIDNLPDERKRVIKKLRKTVIDNLPKGFDEIINYGMIGYVVPHKIYPAGYHCNPKEPLPFLNIASQKNFVAIYHMGIYTDKKLLNWFVGEYSKHSSGKLDMGKSCIRFKNIEKIPYKLIGKLVRKITPNEWIKMYEKNIGLRNRKP